MFTLRERFPFDDNATPCVSGIKNWNTFAVTQDRYCVQDVRCADPECPATMRVLHSRIPTCRCSTPS